VLAIDDGQPVMVVHQFIGRIGNAGSSAHVGTLLLLSQVDHASFASEYASCCACRLSCQLSAPWRCLASIHCAMYRVLLC
jgi:hypothetical protein